MVVFPSTGTQKNPMTMFSHVFSTRFSFPKNWIHFPMPSQEIKSKCAALLEAVGEVPQTVETFLQRLDADLADQKVR